MQRKVRDLALFNLAIDRKLCGCNVVSLKVEGIALHGYTMERPPETLPGNVRPYIDRVEKI